MKRLIITADDFGAALPVNEAVETAHRDGILTATCLMVGAPMAGDAVARARGLPNLKVGLHLVVVRGKSVLDAKRIPNLVDEDGRFDNNLVRAGFRYFFLPRVRRQLAAEIRAQFEAFQATGLPLDHANAHNHMHMHPVVLRMIIDIGSEFGLAAMRLPFEPGSGIFLAPWIAMMRRRLRRAGLRFNDFLFGIQGTGRIDGNTLQRMIAALPDGVSEILLHPATGPWAEMEPEAADFRYEDEFQALLDPAVRGAVTKVGAELIAFGDLSNPS
ncbi:MAG: hopanoid biosynthesis-associated protein HpnK [Rhodospirillales bacterium]|nr:hopanoid biosynthesis-associated protein HpnK [Rhodospirillales bacterium]